MPEPVSETEQELVLVVKMPVFGHPRHLDKAAYRVTKILTDQFNMSELGQEPTVAVYRAEARMKASSAMATVWEQSDRVLYDPRTDDGHHAHKSWWEVNDAAGEVDAAQTAVAGSTGSSNGASTEGTEAHQG